LPNIIDPSCPTTNPGNLSISSSIFFSLLSEKAETRKTMVSPFIFIGIVPSKITSSKIISSFASMTLSSNDKFVKSFFKRIFFF
tara:strand:+ start:2439 stop:2690 length:252 start_codon:yes stop_codon:yes gene_type:complete